MNIRFISSLTPEDEQAIAPALLRAFSSILDLLPIAYSIHIDTTDAQVFKISGAGSAVPADLSTPSPSTLAATRSERRRSS